jgi:hypothetical protein
MNAQQKPEGAHEAMEANAQRSTTARLLAAFGLGVFGFVAFVSAIGLVVCLAGVGLLPFLARIGLPQFPGTLGRLVAGAFALLFVVELVWSVRKLRLHIRQHGRIWA